MSNSYNLAVDLAAVTAAVAAHKAATDATGAIITNIHDVDLPAVYTAVIATGAVVTNIHDVDLPGINLRGQFKKAYLTNGTLTYTDVINITGKGMLYLCFVNALVNDGVIKVTIDGVATDDLTITSNGMSSLSYSETPINIDKLQFEKIAETKILNIEYKASLRVQIKTTNVAGTMCCLVYYGD